MLTVSLGNVKPGSCVDLEVAYVTELAAEGQLAMFGHDGFWQCMDTLRDKKLLEELWQKGDAPWKVWED